MNLAQVTAVQAVVDLLVRKEYGVIEKMTRGRRLPAEELRRAVEGYGGKLVPPPDDAWRSLEVIAVRHQDIPEYFIAIPLWTEEEGRSDLTLELRLTEIGLELYDVQVEDLHVL
jgi:hypothetical protein